MHQTLHPLRDIADILLFLLFGRCQHNQWESCINKNSAIPILFCQLFSSVGYGAFMVEISWVLNATELEREMDLRLGSN